jgi:hypothetical protein
MSFTSHRSFPPKSDGQMHTLKGTNVYVIQFKRINESQVYICVQLMYIMTIVFLIFQT